MSPRKSVAKKPPAKRAKPRAAKPPAKRVKPKATKKPAKREAVERVKVGGLRTLGDVEPAGRGAAAAPTANATTRKALELLEQEFERALALKEKLAAEAAIGGKEKGRDATRQQEKLRALVNSLEGMSRFAMRMGLVTPAQARELYAKAMSQGLYEGWR